MADRVNIHAHPSQLELGQIDSSFLLELFPFAIILDHDMRITNAGEKILETWILQNPSKPPTAIWNSHLVDIFKLRRPRGLHVEWKNILQMNMVMFELELIRCEKEQDNETKDVAKTLTVGDTELEDETACEIKQAAEAVQSGMQHLYSNEFLSKTPFYIFFNSSFEVMDRRGSQGWTRVLLKGQMRYIADMDAIIFLCSPL